MADLLHEQKGTVFWNVVFTRSCQDWELELLQSFFTHLYSDKIEGARGGSLDMAPDYKWNFWGKILV